MQNTWHFSEQYRANRQRLQILNLGASSHSGFLHSELLQCARLELDGGMTSLVPGLSVSRCQPSASRIMAHSWLNSADIVKVCESEDSCTYPSSFTMFAARSCTLTSTMPAQ